MYFEKETITEPPQSSNSDEYGESTNFSNRLRTLPVSSWKNEGNHGIPHFGSRWCGPDSNTHWVKYCVLLLEVL